MRLQKWKRQKSIRYLSSKVKYFVFLSVTVVRICVNCARLFGCLLLFGWNNIYRGDLFPTWGFPLWTHPIFPQYLPSPAHEFVNFLEINHFADFFVSILQDLSKS